MDENRNAFIFYPSFTEQIEAIKDVRIKGDLYRAVSLYGCAGEMPDFSDIDPLGMLDGLFLAIKRAIDDQYKRREIQRRNGAKGGAPIGNNNARRKPETSENNPKQPETSENNLNKDKDKDKKELSNERKKKTRCVFSAPSLDEVKEFFKVNNFSSDPEKFFYHYEANGWRQSNGLSLKKWELAAHGWEKRQPEFAPARSTARHRQQEQPPTVATVQEDEPTDFGGVRY